MNGRTGRRWSTRTLGVTLGTALLAALLATQPVTVSAEAPETAIEVAAASEQVYERFVALSQLPGHQAQALSYLRLHIGQATKYQASLMTLRLENALQAGLPALSKRFAEQAVQQAIAQVYKPGDSLASVRDKTEDLTLKSLLNEASAQGYKLESSEGTYYPVVNYSIFHEFRPHVHEDIDKYILIMATEAREPAVKDAAIVIGYQQLVRRTQQMEAFVAQYPKSNRIAKVKEMFDRYKAMTFYGTSNTELFDHNGQEMRPNARIGYTNILKWMSVEDSDYLKTLGEFMTLAEKYEYQNSAELRDFVKDIFAEQ